MGGASRRYVVAIFALIPILFSALWLYVYLCPSGYMDIGYASWAAKSHLVDSCDVGETVVLGDSLAAVAVKPALLQGRTTNLAVMGGRTIEAFYMLSRALTCARPPRYVLLSIAPHNFANANEFWNGPVRERLLDGAGVAEVIRTSLDLSDPIQAPVLPGSPYPGWMVAWMHIHHVPLVYAESLLKNGLFLRYARNVSAEREYVAANGAMTLGLEPRHAGVFEDGLLKDYVISPTVDAYFDRILDLAASRGVKVGFFLHPINQATASRFDRKIKAKYLAYLEDKAATHPALTIMTPDQPVWPDEMFGDGSGHFNERGWTLISGQLARCLPTLADPQGAAFGSKECRSVAQLSP